MNPFEKKVAAALKNWNHSQAELELAETVLNSAISHPKTSELSVVLVLQLRVAELKEITARDRLAYVCLLEEVQHVLRERTGIR